LSLEYCLNLLIATFCGLLIGIEREARDKRAGVRTQTLVTLGSCLFTIISLIVLKSNNYSGDLTRVAAQIVSGIGFIGGGAILQEKDKVRGLTTASMIWISAAIGMACGFGLKLLAIVSTLVTVSLVLLSRLVSRRIKKITKGIRKPKITWYLLINFDINSSEKVIDFEAEIEKALKPRGFELLEFLESPKGIELSLQGRGKIFSLINEIKKNLKIDCNIKIRESN